MNRKAQPVIKNRAPRKPSAALPFDVDREWDFLEWAAPAFKLPKGWRNRQLKRAARIGRLIAEDDRRASEAERKKAQARLAEYQREVLEQIERDRKLEARQREIEVIEKDRREDSAATWKYLDALAAEIQRRRESNAKWRADAEERLRQSDAAFNKTIVRLERAEFIRRGVLRGRKPKPLTLEDVS
jgi:hypothetical protein